MKVLVSWDANNIWKLNESNSYWSNSIHSYSFIERYLNVFDEVALATRVYGDPISKTKGMMQVDGPNVEIKELPMLRGIKEFVIGYPKLKRAIRRAIEGVDCAILRIPSVIGYAILDEFKKTGKPYAVEVVVDPYDAYKDHKLVQWLFTKKLKESVLNANGASYVTDYTLQAKYPPAAKIKGCPYFEGAYSSIDLKDEFFGTPKDYVGKKSFSIIHTANAIHHDGKGHIELMKALKIVRESGYDVRITFIGDGKKREEYQNYAKEIGIGSYVVFTGLLTGSKAIRDTLINGDLFVLPTKYEGLPRSVIEAMAVGLPCISTPIGGTVELLDAEFLVSPTDVEGLAKKIIYLISNPLVMNKASEENIKKAQKYRIDNLTIKRNKFYMSLKECKK